MIHRRRAGWRLLAVLWFLLQCAAAARADGVASFSLLTYNCAGNGVADWSTNAAQVQALGRQMAYLAPDIVTFQEIPFTNAWQMPSFVSAFLPGYSLATNSGGDGYERSVILSRYPITRSQSWLNRASLEAFGYTNGVFTRDLFEAQLAVPGFPQPLHVLTAHLKAGTASDDRARRAAEAAAISNFLVTVFLTTNATHPYTLSGDMNETDTSQLSIQRLTSAPTGLHLTTPINPFSGGAQTFTIRGSLTKRYDYVFPCALLVSNITSSQVFRTDLLTHLPSPLLATDSATASDHLPVLMTFNNPYAQPFRLLSCARSDPGVTVEWEAVPGQSYRVEVSSNLSTWETLAGGLQAAGYTFKLTTNVSPSPSYLRVGREP